MTQSAAKSGIDLRIAAKILLDRYDELRGERTSAPELELLRVALEGSAVQPPVDILEQALQRIALNIHGDDPAQNIAGDALDSYRRASAAPAQTGRSGLLAEIDWCIKEGCTGPRSHAALTAARASIAGQASLPKLELVGMIVAAHPVHGWHMEEFKPWNEIGAGTRLYAVAPTSGIRDTMPDPRAEQWFSVQIKIAGDDEHTAKQAVNRALQSAHRHGHAFIWNNPVPCIAPDNQEGHDDVL